MTVLLIPAPAARSAHARTTATCSKATAITLVNRYRLNGFLAKGPVAQLLCGAFTGPGSSAMVVVVGGAPTCWSTQLWALFRAAGNAWQLVHEQAEFVIPPIVAVGVGFRVTTPVFRSGDPRCVPSGGKHSRIWRWNGSQVVPGPWSRPTGALPATPTTTTTNTRSSFGFVKTPSGNIECEFSYQPGVARSGHVGCGIHSGLVPPPPKRGPNCSVTDRVFLGAVGRTSTGRSICPGEDEGDAGPFAGGPTAKVLGYGQSWSGGGVRCDSRTDGLTCRNTQGHGFFLSRERWRSF